MSGIVQRLTEGMVNRDMRAEGHALLNKWEKTGLLEGIDKDRSRQAMARLLENQAKELLREGSTMAGGDVEGFAAVAFPIVRRVFAGLIANDLVSVQPMSLPSGLIFFLDFTFSGDLGGTEGAQTRRFGNVANTGSIYGGDKVGSQLTGGLNLLSSSGIDLSGPRTVSARGYAYGSPTGSVAVLAAAATGVEKDTFDVAKATEAQKKLIAFDPDILALSGSGTEYNVLVVDTNKQSYSAQDADFDNLGAFTVTPEDAATVAGVAGWRQIRRLTQLVTQADGAATTTGSAVRMCYIAVSASANITVGTTTVQVPIRDNFNAASAIGAVVGAA